MKSNTCGLSAFDAQTLAALGALGLEVRPDWRVEDRNTWIVQEYGVRRRKAEEIAAKCRLTSRQVRSIASDAGVTREEFRPRNAKAHEAAREWLKRRDEDRPSMLAVAKSYGVSEGCVAGAIYRLRRKPPSPSDRGKLSPHGIAI